MTQYGSELYSVGHDRYNSVDYNYYGYYYPNHAITPAQYNTSQGFAAAETVSPVGVSHASPPFSNASSAKSLGINMTGYMTPMTMMSEDVSQDSMMSTTQLPSLSSTTALARLWRQDPNDGCGLPNISQAISTSQSPHLSLISPTAERPSLPVIPQPQTSNNISQPKRTSAASTNSRTNRVSKDPDAKLACQLCDKTYRRTKSLKRHMLRPDRPYSCRLCYKSFGRTDTLKRHFDRCCSKKQEAPNPPEEAVHQ